MNTNVDAEEIARFEKLAATWWNPVGEMGPLHAINPPRLRYIEQCAGGIKGKRAVDVGCGGGILSEALATRGARVLGIDLAEASLEVARRHAQGADIDLAYESITAEDLAAREPAGFDLVCCLEMLEHVPDPESVVTACARLAKPGGHVVFSTINRNPKAYALTVLGAEYLLNLIPRGTHDYGRFIKPSELERWSRAAGLEIAGMKGLRYNPLLKSASLADDVDVNYLMHCVKPA